MEDSEKTIRRHEGKIPLEKTNKCGVKEPLQGPDHSSFYQIPTNQMAETHKETSCKYKDKSSTRKKTDRTKTKRKMEKTMT